MKDKCKHLRSIDCIYRSSAYNCVCNLNIDSCIHQASSGQNTQDLFLSKKEYDRRQRREKHIAIAFAAIMSVLLSAFIISALYHYAY